MTNPLAAADFFALEAGECLDRLESLVGRRRRRRPPTSSCAPARVLRGSALMAGQQPIARAAGGLEALARALPRGPARRGTRHPGAGRPRRSRSSALLVRRVREWGEADTARAVRLGAEPRGPRGPDRRRSDPAARRATARLNTGVRAFVAREGALIASALDRAARALRPPRRPRAALHRHPPDAVAPRARRAGRAGPAARDPRRHRAGGGRPDPPVRAAARRATR